MIMLLLAALWWIAGMSGFYYWWTKDYDLESSQLLVFFLAGLVGPASWVVGYSLHSGGTVIFRRRSRE
jgi:hypothetical protein